MDTISDMEVTTQEMLAPLEGGADRRELGELIARELAEIERRWSERIAADLVSRPDVHPTQLRAGIRDYLTALSRMLVTDGTSIERTGTETWAPIARDHGITHFRIGFDIGQLIREFITLRHAIQAIARERGRTTAGTEAALADVIDAAIAESVRAYVSTRDHEARRAQAQNVGFITHELRNPLSAAMQAEYLLRVHATPEQQAALQILSRSHARLKKLIDSVLDTQRLEAIDAPQPSDVCLADVVEPAIAVAQREAHAKGLVFSVRGDLDIRARIDPELTRAAIQNLADNAVKYTDLGTVEVALEQGRATWTIHVRDSCPGLSEQELRTIFEPFRRGATTKPGAGLGLAIARRAVEAQGGSIHADSGAQGCHFWITLPLDVSSRDEIRA